jgi:molybdopterin-binding protein
MKISARNILQGTVRLVTQGAVNTEVVIELPGGQEVVSVITKQSAERMNVQPGGKVYAVVKATDVLIGMDH